jgi:hypothetical protein
MSATEGLVDNQATMAHSSDLTVDPSSGEHKGALLWDLLGISVASRGPSDRRAAYKHAYRRARNLQLPQGAHLRGRSAGPALGGLEEPLTPNAEAPPLVQLAVDPTTRCS